MRLRDQIQGYRLDKMDYPRLQNYLTDLYHVPGVAETVRMDHIVRGHYSISLVNPIGITSKIPRLGFMAGRVTGRVTRIRQKKRYQVLLGKKTSAAKFASIGGREEFRRDPQLSNRRA